MELRCLLGHDFGEREVERERREEGDEVVVVYRTVENCQRCGDRRVVSENKEVRSIGALPDAAAGAPGRDEAPADGERPAADERPEADEQPEADDRPPADAPADDGPLAFEADDGASDESAGPAASGGLVEAAEAVGAPGEDGPDAEDAVIIGGPESDPDDGSSTGAEGEASAVDAPTAGGENAGQGLAGGAESGAPGPSGGSVGQGPSAEGGEPESAAESGEQGPSSADEVAPEGGVELIDDGAAGDADAAEDDASADGADESAADGAAGATGEWPVQNPDATDEGYDAAPHDDTATDVEFGGGIAPTAEASDAAADPGFVSADDRSVAARDADGPTELRCPNCGATRTAAGSSLRGGDICPDCRKGYVAERAVDE